MAVVVLAGISRVYPGGVVACDCVDLEAHDGELLVLVGPSGSGKTTTLRLIAGLERPTAGTIRIGEQVVNHVAPRHRDVAMVFQHHALYPHWTVYRNMAFGLELRESAGGRRGMAPDSDIRKRVQQAARQLGLETLLDRMPGELSGGEAQRVAIGRAIVRRPAIFLFDEPFSHLDSQLRMEMRRQLRELQQRLGTTTIYVTHDQAEALALGDRIAVLNRGKIEQIGPPQEIYDWPANRFVAGFVGSPAPNFFLARWVEDGEGSRWRLSAEGWSVDVDRRWWRGSDGGTPAIVGIRPEDIQLGRPDDEQPPDDSPAVTARISLVEHQGDSCVVSLVPSAGRPESPNCPSPKWPGAVLCRCQVSSGLKPGEHVIAWFDMRRAHWFDGQSGRNLRQPGAR